MLRYHWIINARLLRHSASEKTWNQRWTLREFDRSSGCSPQTFEIRVGKMRNDQGRQHAPGFCDALHQVEFPVVQGLRAAQKSTRLGRHTVGKLAEEDVRRSY